jgi:hypothetical protein
MIRNVAVLASPEVRAAHRGLRQPGWQELLMPDEMTQQGIGPSGGSRPDPAEFAVAAGQAASLGS